MRVQLGVESLSSFTGIRTNGDILIFCHDDIELLTADFASKIVARLENFDLLGVAGSRWLRDAMWVSAGLP